MRIFSITSADSQGLRQAPQRGAGSRIPKSVDTIEQGFEVKIGEYL